MRKNYISTFLWMAIAFTNLLFAQDFKNWYNIPWPTRITCQRELANADYMMLFTDKITQANAEGTPVWSKEFAEGGVALGANIELRCMQITSDNGYIITGTYT